MRHAIEVALDDSGLFFNVRWFCWLNSQKVWSPEPPRISNELPDFKHLEGYWTRCAVSEVSVQKFEEYGAELQFQDDDARLTWDFIKSQNEISKIAAQDVADFKTNGKVRELDGVDYGQLAAYQKVGLNNALRLPGYMLFMKQGTGKTPVAIMAICNDFVRRKLQKKYRAIVVTPPNVRINWYREFKKFAPFDVPVQVLRGGQVERMSQIVEIVQNPSPIGVMVCNYETLQGSWDALSFIDFDYAILDESHYIKNPSTKRNHYCSLLKKNASKRLVLTGTPIANDVRDLYAQFDFIGTGTCGFVTFEGFKTYFGRYRNDGFGDKFESAQNLPILKDRLSRYSLYITKEEALPHLPEKNYDLIEVEMTSEQSEAYNRLRDELVIDIEQVMATTESKTVAVQNVLTMLLRLSQITSSFKVIPEVYNMDGVLESARQVIPFAENIKVNAILELLPEKQPNEKTIVWSNWTEDILALEKALLAAGQKPVTFYGKTTFDQRIEAERRFNEDAECGWFLGNPGAGGTGLNLLGYPPDRPEVETDCTHIIYMCQNWNMIFREQSEDRAHRRGTRKPVRITEMVVPGSIDTIIAERVWKKRLNASEALDVREILNELTGLI